MLGFRIWAIRSALSVGRSRSLRVVGRVFERIPEAAAGLPVGEEGLQEEDCRATGQHHALAATPHVTLIPE